MTRSQLQIVDAVPQLSSEMMGAAAHVLEKGGAVVLKELSLYELATFTEGRKHDAEVGLLLVCTGRMIPSAHNERRAPNRQCLHLLLQSIQTWLHPAAPPRSKSVGPHSASRSNVSVPLPLQTVTDRILRSRFAEIRSRSPSTLPRTMGFHWWAEIILVDCPGGLLAATSDSAEETIAEARPRMGFEGCGSRDRRKKDRRKDVAD